MDAPASNLRTGGPAPDFSAIAVGGKYSAGRRISLRDFAGKALALYFYPKDDTPGCTAQACGLRDEWEKFRATGAEIFGVSTDPAASHARFIEKFSLPFPLLSDESKTIVASYGVWVEKSMYGKKYMGTERTSFVIGPDSRIRAIFRKVKPAVHAALLLAAL